MKNIKKIAKQSLWDLSILLVGTKENCRPRVKLLKSLCKNIYETDNGLDAYKIFKEKYIDIIITEINMPIKDGYWLIEKIKEISLLKPIIVFTDSNNLDTMSRCINLGVSSLIQKPSTDEKVLSVLLPLGQILHEKKVMHAYMAETESQILKLSLENSAMKEKWRTVKELLTDEAIEKICKEFSKKHITSKKCNDMLDVLPIKPINQKESFSNLKKDQLKNLEMFVEDDIRIFVDIEEDIRELIGELHFNKENVYEYFKKIGMTLKHFSDILIKYPPYNHVQSSTESLATCLMIPSSKENLNIDNISYLIEAFVNTIFEWSTNVMYHGGEGHEIFMNSIFNDSKMIINQYTNKQDEEGELELF